MKAGRQRSAIPGGRMDGARQHALQSRAVPRLKEDRTPSVPIFVAEAECFLDGSRSLHP
ncbi:hypothetical protein [Anaeromassilibacillus sp. SJQ-1]|uniref:hypothetical protein n=1 Tax=Anaeromassilibacillus sp. SJQ-1 TaxID=3375419 RepID=UPI003988B2A6